MLCFQMHSSVTIPPPWITSIKSFFFTGVHVQGCLTGIKNLGRINYGDLGAAQKVWHNREDNLLC